MRNINLPDPHRIAQLYLLNKSKGLTTSQQSELDTWISAGSPQRAELMDKPMEEFLAKIVQQEDADEQLLRSTLEGDSDEEDPEELTLLGNKDGVKQRLDQIIFGIDHRQSWYRKVFLNHRTSWLMAAAIASIALIIVLLYSRSEVQEAPVGLSKAINDSIFTPGNERAVLTMASGRKVVLGQNSVSLTEGGSNISSDSSVIKYTNISKTGKLLNTLSTALGGMYKLHLPDGTVVWLNAGSEISYPTYFEGKNRFVQLKGEAYFEVSKDSKMPLIVRTRDFSVKVTGTHFNVRAYEADSKLSTTLIEGSVTVVGEHNQVALRPGDASVYYKETPNLLKKEKADIDAALAWKTGDFYFREMTLEKAAKEIANWYNVDIESEYLPELRISMVISREETLETVLKALTIGNNLSFIQTGRKVSIRKKG